MSNVTRIHTIRLSSHQLTLVFAALVAYGHKKLAESIFNQATQKRN